MILPGIILVCFVVFVSLDSANDGNGGSS